MILVGIAWLLTACAEPAVTTDDSGMAEATSGRAELARLGEIVGDARFVNVGEDSHGMPGVHQFVADAFKYLATTRGFRLFVFESAWAIDDGLQDFFNSERTTLQGDETFFLNAFYSPPIVELLVWMRDWNEEHPNDRIRIAGYQPEQPVTDFRALWRFLDTLPGFANSGLRQQAVPCRAGSKEYETNGDFMTSTFKLRGGGQPTYIAQDRSDCLSALAAIDNYLDRHRADLAANSSIDAFREAKLRILSLSAYVGTLTRIADLWVIDTDAPLAQQIRWQGEAYGEGDRVRDEIFNVLMQTRYAGKKAFFWMHNWHAARRASELNRNLKTLSIPQGTMSLGERLAQRYGSELVTIGNIVPCDSTCSDPEESLEPAFAHRFGQSIAIVDLHRPQSGNRILPLFQSGTIMANHHKMEFADVVLNRQFDAVFYMPPEIAGKARR